MRIIIDYKKKNVGIMSVLNNKIYNSDKTMVQDLDSGNIYEIRKKKIRRLGAG